MAEELIRLQVYLARSGVASRRRSEGYITEGRVAVNGRIVTELGTKVRLDDRIEVDGREVRPEAEKVYLALHKPKGYLCSSSDPFGRPLAVDLLEKSFPRLRLYNVGRLDLVSSGLIFFTNDGDFAETVMHPSSGFEKEYLVTTDKGIPEKVLDSFVSGVTIEGVSYRIEGYWLLNPRTVRLVLIEGKNREIRRLFEASSFEVLDLTRTRIGCVTLGGLEPGEHRSLTREEREYFMEKTTGAYYESSH
jgi:23S rRNA pseudouridine2605 synthase